VLTLPSTVRVFVATEAVDMRKSFDGLVGATREVIRANPMLCGGLHYVAWILARRHSSQMRIDIVT